MKHYFLGLIVLGVISAGIGEFKEKQFIQNFIFPQFLLSFQLNDGFWVITSRNRVIFLTRLLYSTTVISSDVAVQSLTNITF
jgi:hypothetical protein